MGSATSLDESWPGRPTGKLAAAVILIVGGGLALAGLGATGAATGREHVATSGVAVLIFLTAVASFWRRRERALSARTRVAWLALSLAQLSLAVGVSAVAWYAARGVTLPAASWADMGLLLVHPLLAAALLLFSRRTRDRADALKVWLDSLSVTIAVAMVTWYRALPGLEGGGWPADAGDWMALGYGVAAMATLAACTASHLRRSTPESRGTIPLLCVSGFALIIHAQIAAFAKASDGAMAGAGSRLLWYSAAAAVIVAVLDPRGRGAPSRKDRPVHPASPRDSSLLRFGGLIAGSVLLVLAVVPGESPTAKVVALGVVALTSLSLLRQGVAAWEGRRLVREHELRETRFRSLVENASDITAVMDEAGHLTFLSRPAERILGWSPELLPVPAFRELVHPDDLGAFDTALERAARSPGRPFTAVWRLRHADGAWVSVESAVTNLLHDPAVAGIVLNARDVTARLALEAELTYQAEHDSLTRLANRKRFRTEIAQALENTRRRGPDCAVLLLDLDEFKQVNDTLGHPVGDELLVQVADRLLDATRGIDTVARVGGDEFGILLPRVSRPADVRVVTDRILAAFREPFRLSAGHVFVGVSIGVAVATESTTMDDLLRNADIALYDAKRRGRGQCSIFEPHMEESLRARVQLEADMRRAIDEGQFEVVFQPIVELASGRIKGAEALVRWAHPEQGALSPLEFIPLAESTGTMVPLGRWVLARACLAAASWKRLAEGTDDFTLNVNVSGAQLGDPAFVSDVRETLDETGFPATSLVFEVGESVLAEAGPVVSESMVALRSMGIRVAVDDFGTGRSSLGLLQRFPIDLLKIDRSLLTADMLDERQQALARMIVALGEVLTVEIVAEGVENLHQADVLSGMGCGLAQGYFFSTPVGVEEMAALFGHSLRPEPRLPLADAAGA